MTLTFQPHSLKERPGLGIMKHTKPETQDSSNKSVSGTITVSKTKQTTPLVLTKVKDTEQESKINELTKLVQMLIDEKVNSNQKTQESNSKIQKTELSKSIDSSKLSQDSKPKVQNTGSSKIIYCMICKREDHKTSDHEMCIASLKRSENYKAQPYQYAYSSKQILKVKAKPFPPCTYCGFNDHRPDDCRNTLPQDTTVDTPGSPFVPGQWMLKEYDWCQELSAQICIATSISQLCDAKYIVQFDDKQGTISNVNKEIVLIAPRRIDVYVLDMSSLTLNGACFLAKASESVNRLWHKRLSNLNFKNSNKLAKQNKVLGLPSLCLHLLHMDLFGPISPMSINHEKYTIVIVDEYSRMVENQNDVKVKQIITDNGAQFRNHELESFCDEKGISQNFSSPYTPDQNGVAVRKNRTLIKAARTMLNGSVLSKHFWTEAVRIACYT
ncbi:retrovirus-related pol polyprotein from transposon TNT 1-94 [Tanacetum coccineum]